MGKEVKQNSNGIRNQFAETSLMLVRDEYKHIGIPHEIKCCVMLEKREDEQFELCRKWKSRFKDAINITQIIRKETEAVLIEKNYEYNNNIQNNVYCSLHSNAFSFIYLDLEGSCAQYLDSVAHSISHRGIIVITSKDISTLFNKCPERAIRLYNGRVVKTDYTLELAVRIILANIVTAAARWDKGVVPLSCYGSVDGITVIVKILKGSKHSDNSVKMLEKVAHCRQCLCRSFLSEGQYAPTKTASQILNCSCVEDSTMKINAPIILLGKAWTSEIYKNDFILNICNYASVIEPTKSFIDALKLIALECKCFPDSNDEASFVKTLNNVVYGKEKFDIKFITTSNASKDKCAFFYNPQSYGISGKDPPKLPEVILALRSKKHRACRTHFYLKGVRSSANTKELKEVLMNISKSTSKIKI